MEIIHYFDSLYLFENSVWTYIQAIVIYLAVVFGLKFAQSFVITYLKKITDKTKNQIDDIVVEIISDLKAPFFIFIAIYVSLIPLTIPHWIYQIFYILLIFFVVFEAIRAVNKISNFFIQKYIEDHQKKERKVDPQETKMLISAFQIFGTILIWVIGIITILSNLGVNVTSLLASLGIAGIAIALAVQNVLGDVFSSFSIYLDKPFRVGDFIVIGDEKGTVEKIGVKTTRIRTLLGDELVISNKELMSSRIHNFKKMQKRRIELKFGVTYNTPKAKLEKIPQIISDIIENIDDLHLDRCHFKGFGSSSLDFEAIYFVKTGNYNTYMDKNQQIHLTIIERFEKENIQFAYPTQTIYVHKE